jgi:hypothetical protein
MQEATLKTSRVDPKIPKINPKWKEMLRKTTLALRIAQRERQSQKTFVANGTVNFGDTYLERTKTQKDFSPQMKEKISFVNSDIRGDASLLRVVTPPAAGIA